MAAEGRDGPVGQGSVCSHQEAGHRPAGREREERQGQRGTLRNTHTTVIEAVHTFSAGHTHWITVLQTATTVQHVCRNTLPATACEIQHSRSLWCTRHRRL